MISIVKRIVYGSLVLLIIPICALIWGWTWQPTGSSIFLKLFYWITETSSFPWAGISCVILALWFTWLLKLKGKQAILLISLLAVAVLLGQAVKSLIKETIEEPRPFVVWLQSEYKVDEEMFYDLPREKRAELVKNVLVNDTRVPSWLSYHWQNETGYAFPSGHTLFTATWALLSLALLWPSRQYIAIIVLTGWAMAVATSRLVMGMHFPIDLIVSTLMAAIIAWAVGIVANRLGMIKNLNDSKDISH